MRIVEEGPVVRSPLEVVIIAVSSKPVPTGTASRHVAVRAALAERHTIAQLSDWMSAQRWYAGKARELDSARIVEAASPDGFPDGTLLLLVETRYRDGRSDTYFIPARLAGGPQADRLSRESPGRIIARFDGPRDGRLLYDGMADPEVCQALLDAKGRGRQMPPPVLIPDARTLDGPADDDDRVVRAVVRVGERAGLGARDPVEARQRRRGVRVRMASGEQRAVDRRRDDPARTALAFLVADDLARPCERIVGDARAALIEPRGFDREQ